MKIKPAYGLDIGESLDGYVRLEQWRNDDSCVILLTEHEAVALVKKLKSLPMGWFKQVEETDGEV